MVYAIAFCTPKTSNIVQSPVKIIKNTFLPVEAMVPQSYTIGKAISHFLSDRVTYVLYFITVIINHLIGILL